MTMPAAPRARRRPTVVLLLVGLVAALGLAACGTSSTDDDATDDSTPQRSTGDATVTLGDDTLELALTSCQAADGRLTFQGDDGAGTTIVGTFAIDDDTGTLTLTDADGAWTAGNTAGQLDDLDITDTTARGDATFAIQTYGDVDPDTDNRPVEDTDETIDGDFTATCDT